MPVDILFGRYESRKKIWKDLLLLLAGFGVFWGARNFNKKDE